MHHDAGVTVSPPLTTGTLLTHETIFHPQLVVRQLILVEEMTETVVKPVVLIIAHLEQTILHTEGVAIVVTCLIAGDLGRPTGQVLPVEE